MGVIGLDEVLWVELPRDRILTRVHSLLSMPGHSEKTMFVNQKPNLLEL